MATENTLDCFIATECLPPDRVACGAFHFPKVPPELGARLLAAIEGHAGVRWHLRHEDFDGDLVGVSFDADSEETFLDIVRKTFGDDLSFGKENENVIVGDRPRSLLQNYRAFVKPPQP